MKIKRIKRRRNIEYYFNLNKLELIDSPFCKFSYQNSIIEVFKLSIKNRNCWDINFGEIDFILRNKEKHYDYAVIYCYMEQPDEICSISYYLNDKVLMPDGNLESLPESLIPDDETFQLHVMDFIKNHIYLKYQIKKENSQ